MSVLSNVPVVYCVQDGLRKLLNSLSTLKVLLAQEEETKKRAMVVKKKFTGASLRYRSRRAGEEEQVGVRGGVRGGVWVGWGGVRGGVWVGGVGWGGVGWGGGCLIGACGGVCARGERTRSC